MNELKLRYKMLNLSNFLIKLLILKCTFIKNVYFLLIKLLLRNNDQNNVKTCVFGRMSLFLGLNMCEVYQV